jgi:hypothetical protein
LDTAVSLFIQRWSMAFWMPHALQTTQWRQQLLDGGSSAPLARRSHSEGGGGAMLN